MWHAILVTSLIVLMCTMKNSDGSFCAEKWASKRETARNTSWGSGGTIHYNLRIVFSLFIYRAYDLYNRHKKNAWERRHGHTFSEQERLKVDFKEKINSNFWSAHQPAGSVASDRYVLWDGRGIVVWALGNPGKFGGEGGRQKKSNFRRVKEGRGASVGYG